MMNPLQFFMHWRDTYCVIMQRNSGFMLGSFGEGYCVSRYEGQFVLGPVVCEHEGLHYLRVPEK